MSEDDQATLHAEIERLRAAQQATADILEAAGGLEAARRMMRHTAAIVAAADALTDARGHALIVHVMTPNDDEAEADAARAVEQAAQALDDAVWAWRAGGEDGD